ncbi:MAG: cation-translocating P-type ATPase [Bacteroidetes bacterium]|nr:cation-translocating P-type ATPase [Bacteroidota bacterium]
MIKGLTAAEANKKLLTEGYNELPSTRAKSVWHIAFEVIKEPMFLLLISSGILYILLGDTIEGIILMSTTLIIIFITFYQYQKTEKALDALKRLSSPRALVIRDGVEVRIPGREVVVGDMIRLHEGDRVPADAKIIESLNLMVDESMLTGESIPVQKNPPTEQQGESEFVYSGTLVVGGKGIAEVIAIAQATQFGKIGKSLQGIVQDSTRLQIEMQSLIKKLFIIGGILSVGVVAAFYFTRGNFIQSLLSGLSAAMAILPEEFPVVLTVFLALGAWRLSKIHVLTRNPSVIETLGSATVLCTDKTGTITQNRMELAYLYDGEHLIEKAAFVDNKSSLSQLMITAQLASQFDAVDPMEKAIGNTYSTLALPPFHAYELIREYPLSKQLFAMTRVVKNTETGEISISSKGAPEAIMGLCNLTEAEKSKHLKIVNELADKGYRVLAVANVSKSDAVLPENQSDFVFHFCGLLGLEDPIRTEVPHAIKECYHAGIKVMMITGDYPITARSIANQIGLKSDVIITGDEMSKMDDETLKKEIVHATIFARVQPEQKLRIVQALKANHEIVAMTGDGVNDAPALKASHIGISMGNKGTDVAREASSLVLLDDNFASIVAAVRSGRRIFDNLQKAMSYIIAIHIPIIGLTLLPAFFSGLPLLLMTLHIVFMELIIDPVCSIAFEYEQEEKGIMNRPPRNPADKFFGWSKIMWSVFQGILLLAMVLIIYFLSIHEGHTEGEVRAIAFSALIIGNVFLILADLSKTRSFFAVFTERNYAVLFIITAAVIMLVTVISVPKLQDLFSFEFPGYSHFISAGIGSISVIAILELIKLFKIKRKKRKYIRKGLSS